MLYMYTSTVLTPPSMHSSSFRVKYGWGRNMTTHTVLPKLGRLRPMPYPVLGLLEA